MSLSCFPLPQALFLQSTCVLGSLLERTAGALVPSKEPAAAPAAKAAKPRSSETAAQGGKCKAPVLVDNSTLLALRVSEQRVTHACGWAPHTRLFAHARVSGQVAVGAAAAAWLSPEPRPALLRPGGVRWRWVW